MLVARGQVLGAHVAELLGLLAVLHGQHRADQADDWRRGPERPWGYFAADLAVTSPAQLLNLGIYHPLRGLVGHRVQQVRTSVVRVFSAWTPTADATKITCAPLM